MAISRYAWAIVLGVACMLVAACPPWKTNHSIPISYTADGQPYLDTPDGRYFLGRAGQPTVPPGFAVPPITTYTPPAPRMVLPTSVDLSWNQTPIRDQGGRDTCTVFAMTAALEAAYNRLYGVELDLSEQYLNHVQKALWLNSAATLPGAEIQPETNAGGNLEWHTFVLQRYGLPLESELPYVSFANYQNTDQAGDVPSGLNTATQRAQDDFSLSDVSHVDSIPEALTHTVLPQIALAGARYRPITIVTAPATSLNDLFWYKQQLAAGREVAIMMSLRGPVPWRLTGVWTVPPAPVCNPGPCPADPVHALLLAGYNDTDRVFLIKNSWGPNWTPSTFLGRLSYDWIEQKFIAQAISIVDVVDPSASFGVRENPQLSMGRWNVDYNGRRGTLDVYRVAGDGTPAQPDRRIGTLFQDDGTALRVNATVPQQRIEFHVNWSTPDQPVTTLSGTVFTGFLFSAQPRVLAGSYVDQRDGKTYPLVAWKDTPPNTVAGAPTLSLNAYKGRWMIHYDGSVGQFDIKSVNAQTRALSIDFLDQNGGTIPMTGIVQADLRNVTLQLAGTSVIFHGQLATGRLGLMAGTYSQGTSGTLGFYARRTGNIPTTPNRERPTPDEALCLHKPSLAQCR